MENVTLRFTVMTNENIYWATSIKAAVAFCKKNDFQISRDWEITPSISDINLAEKAGRGVWCVSF